MNIMENTYNPKDIEQLVYKIWEQGGYFKSHGNKAKESFCIMMPPPNITGSLHMGHAFQHTIMDLIIRYQRMQGKNTLWQTGMDHAGIATQIVVERKMMTEEGKSRMDYSRNDFINIIWQWKKQSSNTIASQMRRLGDSVDWDRECFTMDDSISNAVREVFVRLYMENLIYRGKCIVNWNPKLCTAISDLEVDKRKSKGFMWYIRYPLAEGIKTVDEKDYLLIATTRPETILGDTAVAVHPEDIRYKNLIGKFIILPLVNRRIPIIGDRYANMKRGTGCVKITPAHDFNDYEVGRRHMLPMINILTSQVNIREKAQVFDYKGNESNCYSTDIPIQFQKLDILTARKKIVSAINTLGLLEEIKQQYVTVLYSNRDGVIVEPMLTDQWFVRASILAKPAVKAVKDGDIKFISKQYKNMYLSWMKNIHDWCISRQTWWGHRIPAWYDNYGNTYVGRTEKEVRQNYNLSNDFILKQDEDVLDTWFSSSLWTFVTLGWPNNSDVIHQFHPTNVIVSGFDIIFFWIARMIMMTMHFIKDDNGNPQVPFKIVYITGLVRDEDGNKMSKSQGNVIDPMDIIDGISLQELINKRIENMIQSHLITKISEYTKKQFPNGIKPHGADAIRLTLTSLSSVNRDINWDMKRLEGYRNFCNKLWNASRFVLKYTKNYNYDFNSNTTKVLSFVDLWIITKLNLTIRSYRKALDNFHFDIAVNILYEFIWNQFCDWYLEFTKLIIRNINKAEILGTYNTLITVLEILLRLAHPIMPFITEVIWQDIKLIAGINANTIMLQPFPEYDALQINKVALLDIEWLKQVITAIRNMRAEIKILPNKPITLFLLNCNDIVIRRIDKNQHFLRTMANLDAVTILSEKNQYPISVSRMIEGTELIIDVSNLINKTHALEQLTQKIAHIEEQINNIKNKLNNKTFLSKAPEKIVVKEQEKLANYKQIKLKLIKQQDLIKGM